MKQIITKTVAGFFRAKCQYRASALAYTTALAFVPFLSVIVALLSKFAISSSTIVSVQEFIFKNFVPSQGEKILDYVQQFTVQAQEMPKIGFCFLIVMTVVLLSLVGKNINRLWHIRESRRWYRRQATYFLILIAVPVFMLLSLTLSSYFYSVEWLAENGVLIAVRTEVLRYLPSIIELIGFTLLNWMVPNCKVQLRYAVLGGILTTALFECIKLGFSLYLDLFPAYNLLYGALAIVPIFLVWLYLFWMVVMLGTVFVYVCQREYSVEPKMGN
jgi:membrane protein